MKAGAIQLDLGSAHELHGRTERIADLANQEAGTETRLPGQILGNVNNQSSHTVSLAVRALIKVALA